jgi:hypothetical protein
LVPSSDGQAAAEPALSCRRLAGTYRWSG